MSSNIKEKANELVRKSLKAGKITSYEDFVKTELASETKLDNDEIKYYKGACEVING